MTTLIELKPNRDLLDSKFEGYKLSLESVPIFCSNLKSGVHHILPSDDQYSFLHVKVFGLHNHLYGDPWSLDDIYYIDTEWHVQKNVFPVGANAGRIDDWTEVWAVPGRRDRGTGHYNASLHFTAPSLAVLADGAGSLHLLDTGVRPESPRWRALFAGRVCGEDGAFVVVDSRAVSTDGQRTVHCLVQHVQEARAAVSEEVPSEAFKTVLEWITLSEEDHVWSLLSIRKLSGAGAFDYAAFERDCRCLYIASDKAFGFIIDSEKAVEMLSPLEPDEEKTYFSWMQTSDSLTVWVPASYKPGREDLVAVSVKDDRLCVAVGGRALLEGPTWQRVDAQGSSWRVDDGKVEVTLPKAEHGIHWPELVRGNVEGEEIVDPASTEQPRRRPAPETEGDGDVGCSPGFNAEQLEECDSLPDMLQLVRLDSHSHSVTHQINLGGHQWLFSARLSPDDEPALCLRFDVDGCVWQVGPPVGDSAEWPCTHVKTFLAFGYVQASKTQRKFTVCSPDMSYVAICEANRHVYLYRQPTPVDGELRNRKSGRSVNQIAKQQLVTLDSTTEVLGIHCSDSYIYVLTIDKIHCLQINCYP